MVRATWLMGLVVGCLFLSAPATAQEWPQWRGPNRDARATGFKAPATWPKEPTKKWSVTVGDGVATPALVGGKLFVFTRQDGNEIIRGLDAATGDELWKDEYPAEAPGGGARNFPGPRSSPTVADGKVVTLGVDGVLSCYDADSGRMLWRKERKDEFGGEVPMFYTSSSPIVVNGMCIAQLGGGDDGGIVAFDLTSGDERWRWTEDSPSYGSPVLMSVDGANVIIAPTEKNLVAMNAADGKLMWEIPYEQGRYNSATPIVDGQTLILAGPGTGITAIKLAMQDGQLKEEKVWSNTDNSVQFNTPVLRDGLLFGLSNGGQLFCINTRENTTTWTAPVTRPAADGQERERAARAGDGRVKAMFVQLAQQDEGDRPRRGDGEGRGRGEGFRRGEGRGEGRGFGRGGRGRGGRRGGGGGYGSIVDAGPVLMALTPAAELVVFEPSGEAFKELARYKIAEGGTYAYPVPAANAIYIKDQESLTKWTVE